MPSPGLTLDVHPPIISNVNLFIAKLIVCRERSLASYRRCIAYAVYARRWIRSTPASTSGSRSLGIFHARVVTQESLQLQPAATLATLHATPSDRGKHMNIRALRTEDWWRSIVDRVKLVVARFATARSVQSCAPQSAYVAAAYRSSMQRDTYPWTQRLVHTCQTTKHGWTDFELPRDFGLRSTRTAGNSPARWTRSWGPMGTRAQMRTGLRLVQVGLKCEGMPRTA
ncbi:hypothetical protein C2E23DRAFT_460222 [Lenzites betulinus]|nr:hypothetical protein C2E23DRAFT_460222 [Lenzites betulinus]